jgi:PAS domain S-box-containing protein
MIPGSGDVEKATKTRILVVEDESIVALDLQDRLREIGYSVPALARSGESAIKKVAEIQPDLILMDINLDGEMDGIEAAERIRREFDIPVIFLTAFSDRATLERARFAGPYGYILKPFEIENVHSAIEMAVHRHRLENQLRDSERRFRRLFEQSHDAIIVHTLDGLIQDANNRACQMLGLDRDALLQTAIQSLQPDDELEATRNSLQNLSESGAIQYESRFTRANGTEIITDISASLIDREEGLVQAVIRDITDRVLSERELHAQKIELEARNEELNAFAHTVAHDLKASLGLITGYLLLMEEHLGDKADMIMDKSLQVVLHQSGKMNNIIDALLLLAGVRNTLVEVQPLDMEHIVKEALARLEKELEKSHAEVILPTCWPRAIGYPPWVEEVWVNYVSNAIKYGGKPPRLELGADIILGNCSSTPIDGRDTVCFWVKDNGPGLSSREQARLFTPFTRLHRTRAAGHGLGLSIVRRIVEKLNGQVSVTSVGVPGRGSTFYFSLPMADTVNGSISSDEDQG